MYFLTSRFTCNHSSYILEVFYFFETITLIFFKLYLYSFSTFKLFDRNRSYIFLFSFITKPICRFCKYFSLSAIFSLETIAILSAYTRHRCFLCYNRPNTFVCTNVSVRAKETIRIISVLLSLYVYKYHINFLLVFINYCLQLF